MPPAHHAFLNDAHYLQLALQQARMAAHAGEVPVGAVVVSPNGQVLGQGHNRTISDHDPSAHAEIQALRAAAQHQANHRLDGCTLYVTLEPCAMCSGALLHARLARVVYAIADPKTGAAGSTFDLFAHSKLNHQTVCTPFVPANSQEQTLRDQCTNILQIFFQQRRRAQATLRQHPLQAALREDTLRLPTTSFAHMAPLLALKHWSQFVLLNDPDSPRAPLWRMHVLDTAPNDLSRPAVLLLHGYASYSMLWADTIQQLHANGWRVLAPDLLGHGQSDKPKKMQRHSLAWHTALLQQWLAQARFGQHVHRATILHDSAILLLQDLHAACITHHMPLTHTICLYPQGETRWRQQCQARPSFDLDVHWALTSDEVASRLWSAPWPDKGHRAALQWPLWANGPEGPSLHTTKPGCEKDTHGTITAAAQSNVQTINVPASGSAFRQWLQQHGHDLLGMLQTHAPQP